MGRIPENEVTPRELYFNRRSFMRGGIVAAGAVATGWLYRKINGVELIETETAELTGLTRPAEAGFAAGGEKPTPLLSITNYNNFYEFSTDKDGVASAAQGFATAGWQVEVGGLVHQPRKFDLDDLRKISSPEERIYRMRCVEAWSMVVPWAGYSLSRLLDRVRPMAGARYVAFETLHDPVRMPGQKSDVLPWPYVEGLRIDEAMHPLTLLTTGLYGHELPPQDGAPVRLIVPWKYGFFANVNPHHDHPRWSQATEQRIGESGRRKTLMFNGYADEVAGLYSGMDLDVYF
ncbi:MAG TPA: protein-methionine-sulfoxide reductase catalytic subunit MsrP [Kofleriaceae bacterium]|nr:protein-methionine-sulfoxide reductase catalytic subunit MsrP [Kofleriaceae bacterium]